MRLSSHSSFDMVTQELIARIRSVFEAPDYKPPVLPSVALEVQALAHRNSVELTDVVRVLERDPLLAADVLRVAHSPFYATRQPAKSLHDAVVRLGLSTINKIVWEVALSTRIFRSEQFAYAMESLRRHSSGTAHVARLIWEHRGPGDDSAFLSGLLHKVGLAIALIAIEESEHLGIDALQAQTALEHMYSATGQWICRRWHLPHEIELVIAHHDNPTIGGETHHVAATVCAAAHFVSGHGRPVELGPRATRRFANIDDETADQCWSALGISEIARRDFETKAAALLERLTE